MGKVPLGEGAPKRFQLVLKIFALHESIGAQLERPAWHKHASAFFGSSSFWAVILVKGKSVYACIP